MIDNIILNDCLILLYNMLVVLTGSVCTIAVVYVLQICFAEGQIFERYLPWLASVLVKETPEVRENLDRLADDPYAAESYLMDYAFTNVFFYKPLGGCAFCMAVWIAVYSFWALPLIFGISFWIWPLYPFICGLLFKIVGRLNILS